MKRAQLWLLIATFTTMASVYGAEPQLVEYKSKEWVNASGKPMTLGFDDVMRGLENCFEMKAGFIGNSKTYQGRSPSDAGLEIRGKKSAITTIKLLVSLYKYDQDTYDLNVAILTRFMSNCVPGLLEHKDWLKKAVGDHGGPLGASRTVFGDKLIDVQYPFGNSLRMLMITIQAKEE
jgi:hypothetical protein